MIGGWLGGEGGRAGRLGALVVGYHDEAGALRYAGRVGTGFDDRELDRLGRLLAERARDTQPVRGPPAAEADPLRRARPRRRRRLLRVDLGPHAAPALLQGPARRHPTHGRARPRRLVTLSWRTGVDPFTQPAPRSTHADRAGRLLQAEPEQVNRSRRRAAGAARRAPARRGDVRGPHGVRAHAATRSPYRVAERPAAPAAPRRLRGRARERDPGRLLSGGRQGVR